MKKVFLAMCFFVSAASVQAQVDTATIEPGSAAQPAKKFDASRLVFGGNIGANFGDFTFVNISPQVGYTINKYLTAGAGVNFIYTSQKFRTFSNEEAYRYNSGYAGLNVFARAFPVRFLMVSVQPELNYNWGKIKYDQDVYPNTPDEKLDGKFVPSLLLGGGVVIPTGARGGLMISLQYDVIQNDRSPYGSNAFFNVGFVL